MLNVGLVIEGEDKQLYILILFRTSRIENEENAKKEMTYQEKPFNWQI